MNRAILSQPVVVDNGTGVVKAGMAGGDRPTVVFPSTVGRPKHVRMMPGGALEGRDVVVGRRALEHRGALVLRQPMARGMVEDWDDMERVWAYAFGDEGLGVPSDAHPLLLTEAPLNAARHREHCAEVLFEHFNVPALYLAPQAILSLYASGRTTGLVVDVGDGVSHAVPVYEGFAVQHAITRMDVAGRDVTERLGLLLRRAGCSLTTSAERELCRDIKERRCYVALEPAKDEVAMLSAARNDTKPPPVDAPNAAQPLVSAHQLPDGSRVVLGPERFRAPEVLFDPSIVGSEAGGVPKLLALAAQKSDLDLRATLCSQIVLAGGSTLFPGFGDRLLHDLKSALPQHTKIRIHVSLLTSSLTRARLRPSASSRRGSAAPSSPRSRLSRTCGSCEPSELPSGTLFTFPRRYEEHGARLFSTRALA